MDETLNYVVDRIEDGIAVLECIQTNEVIEMPRGELPKGCREGLMLQKGSGGYAIDQEATKKRREMIQSKLDRLLKRK